MTNWTQSYSGRQIRALDLRVEDIDIVDIAQGLSQTCRYCRQTKSFYSVAQHSVLVARHASAEDALRALMHDAVEVYSPFGDIATPDRKAIADEFPEVYATIETIEARIDMVIAAKFDLPYPIKNKAISILDTRILMDERAQVMTPTEHEWGIVADPLGVEIELWSPVVAREKFLNDFDLYSKWNRQLNGRAA